MDYAVVSQRLVDVLVEDGRYGQAGDEVCSVLGHQFLE
jgi:hypothetical protein